MKISFNNLLVIASLLISTGCHSQGKSGAGLPSSGSPITKYKYGIGLVDSGSMNGKVKSLLISDYGTTDNLYAAEPGDATLFSTDFLQFDANGNTILHKESLHGSGNSEFIEIYKYDGAMKLAEEECYNIPDTNKEITKYSYDAKGNETEKIVYSKGEFESKTTYIYDAAGHLMEDNYTDYQGSCQNTKYKYDRNGRVVEDTSVTHAYGQVTVSSTKLVYDTRGNEVQSFYLFGALHSAHPKIVKRAFKYNAAGDMIEDISSMNGKTDKTTFLYEGYDAHRNWLKRTTWLNKRSIYITRQIEYY